MQREKIYEIILKKGQQTVGKTQHSYY